MPDAELTNLINTLPAAQRPVVEAYLNADWQTYERLDPDRTILRAVYELAPRELRRALGAVGRTGGRTEIVEILATSHTASPTPHIPTTPTEADVLFEMLTAQKRYADLWGLAQTAAPLLSARILVWLANNGWQPETDEDKAVFPHLVKLARACADLSPQYGLMYKKRRISFYRTFERSYKNSILSNDGKLLIIQDANKLLFYTVPDKRLVATIISDYFNHTNSTYGRLNDNCETGFLLWIESVPDKSSVVHVIDLTQRRIVKTITGLYNPACKLFMLDNNNILSANFLRTVSDYYPWSLHNIKTGKTENYEGPKIDVGYPVEIAISPNKKLIAGVQNQKVWFWSIEEKQWLTEINIDGLRWGKMFFTADNKHLIFAENHRRVYLIEVKSGRVVQEITVPNPSILLGFSANEKFLAICSRDNAISIFDMQSRSFVQFLPKHHISITKAVFSDNQTIVTSSFNRGFTRVWASHLTELCERPLEQNEMRILRWMSKQLNRPDLTAAERGWLEFTQAMLHLRWRYAVEIETDAAYKTHAATADIEL